MRQFLLTTEVEVGETFRLEAGDFHYLAHVLRISEGDRFDLLDAAGKPYRARVTSVGESHLIAETELPRSAEDSAGVDVTLYQALPKGQKFDAIIRQSVQAGATLIVPIVTRRSIVREAGQAKLERWNRIAREAVQQSGAASAVEVRPATDLRELVAADRSVSLFLHTKTIAQQTLHSYLDRVPEQVELVVGPEGGFTAEEIGFLTDRGFLPLYLGPRVLRTETAALFVLGAVQILLQERDSWLPTA